MAGDTIRLAAVGFGGFAQFAIEQFLKVPGVQLAGLAGTRREAAFAYVGRHGLSPPQTVEQLVAREDIDVVYIATPPFLHHSQALLALQAGKHVICEKPLALSLAQADEMIETARRCNRVLATNLMQRYNPLADTVGRLISSRILGEVLHGFFENYASDEGLPPGHWFWNPDMSGSILVEHGVHFFDLVGSWLGAGTVLAAQQTIRPSTRVREQAQATVRYHDTILFNFYHGFTQPSRMDRQELRLVFERGDVSLYEWVPRWGRVHALVSERQAAQLEELLPDAHAIAGQRIEPDGRQVMARHQTIRAERMLAMTFACQKDPQVLYGRCLQDMLADQLAWMADRTHPRVITETTGRDCLAVALEAVRMAGAGMEGKRRRARTEG